jgi:hypothetical protein
MLNKIKARLCINGKRNYSPKEDYGVFLDQLYNFLLELETKSKHNLTKMDRGKHSPTKMENGGKHLCQ